MKETILLYHIADQDRLHAIQRALLPLGMRIRMVQKEEYLQPVGFLAGVKEIQSGTEQYEGEELEKEMMVMAGLSSGRIDAVLMALRRSGAGDIVPGAFQGTCGYVRPGDIRRRTIKRIGGKGL